MKIMFGRRDFLRTSFGALFASAMPVLAKAPEATKEQQRGMGIPMSAISNGPFISFCHKFKWIKSQLSNEFVNYACVKISSKEYHFDQFGLTQNLYNAEEFLRRLGYKSWIVTDEVYKWERPSDDKKLLSDAYKFGEAFDKFRKK